MTPICKHCGKPIWGEGWDPKTGRRFYSHIDDGLEKHGDGKWVEPARIAEVIYFFQQLPDEPELCFYCGVKLVRLRLENTSHPMARFVRNQFTRDHVEPMSLGGSKKKRNIVSCCRKCNNAKGRRTIEQYRALLGHGECPVEFYAEKLYRLSTGETEEKG